MSFLESDCILHGYIKKLGGPFASAWQTRYAKLYPNRLELHSDSGSTKPELVFMDQIEDVSADLVHVKNEQCIVIRTRDAKIVLTNPVSKIIHSYLSRLYNFVPNQELSPQKRILGQRFVEFSPS